MDNTTKRTLLHVPIFYVELILWLAVIGSAIYSAYSGYNGSGLVASDADYMWGYVVLSLVFSPILAGILAFSMRAKLHGSQLRLVTIALPSFLLAVILHIAAWGVSASRWLVYYQPEIGSSLWTFVHLATPLCLAITTTYAYKLWRFSWDTQDTFNTDSLKKHRSLRHRLRTIWTIILTLIFLVQFVVIAVGAYLTAIDVPSSWFSPNVSNWTHAIVIVNALLLITVMVFSALVSKKRITEFGVSPKNSDTPARRTLSISWIIVLGPLIISLIHLVVSVSSLLFSDVLSTEAKWNTGIVLFVAYGSSLLPSYVIVSILHLISRVEPERQNILNELKESIVVEN